MTLGFHPIGLGVILHKHLNFFATLATLREKIAIFDRIRRFDVQIKEEKGRHLQ
jgi:hypothetical protein